MVRLEEFREAVALTPTREDIRLLGREHGTGIERFERPRRQRLGVVEGLGRLPVFLDVLHEEQLVDVGVAEARKRVSGLALGFAGALWTELTCLVAGTWVVLATATVAGTARRAATCRWATSALIRA